MKALSQDIQCHGRDSKRGHTKHKSRPLQLYQPFRLQANMNYEEKLDALKFKVEHT
jgi:hypothetical protein